MLLSENKVWDVISGKSVHPQDPAVLSDAEQAAIAAATHKMTEKAVTEWDKKNEVTIRIISFTVTDRLEGSVHYSGNAKGAWEELQKVHAFKDIQHKYSLMRRLLNLGSQTQSSLHELEETFDVLVQSLEAIGKKYLDDELIIYFTNSLPNETFGNWIQA